VDECLLVDLVAEFEFGGQVAQLLELHADALQAGDVVVVRAPQGQAPVLVSD